MSLETGCLVPHQPTQSPELVSVRISGNVSVGHIDFHVISLQCLHDFTAVHCYACIALNLGLELASNGTRTVLMEMLLPIQFHGILIPVPQYS